MHLVTCSNSTRCILLPIVCFFPVDTLIFSNYYQVMVKKEEQKLAKFFGNAFREVALPEFEKLHQEIKEVKENVSLVQETVEKVERKFVKIDDRLDRHGKTIDTHEVQIKSLESLSIT